MARYDFGGSVPDFIFTTVTSGGTTNVMRLPTGGALTFYSAKTGGTQYTDLRLASAPNSPVSTIAVGTDGQIPDFQGPDGVSTMWATGGLSRVRMVSWSVVGGGGAGTPGAPGAPGAPGSEWFWVGATEPATSLGVIGDWAMRSNGAVYEKTGGSAWTLRMNLTGPSGSGGTGIGAGGGNVFMQPIWDGTGSHPTRPAGATYVIWRQPTAPLTSAGYAVSGDEWEPI